MVKGTNRRVIVVRSPDQLFEEAIFVLKEDGGAPKDASLVIDQARRAAGDYLKKCGVPTVKHKRRRGLALFLLCLLLAGVAAAAAWFLLMY